MDSTFWENSNVKDAYIVMMPNGTYYRVLFYPEDGRWMFVECKVMYPQEMRTKI